MWRLVLHAPSLSTPTPRTTVEQVGTVVGIADPFTSHVTVRMQPGGETRSVHMAWADRPEGFASFLELCDAFCLHVGVCAQSVVSYSLYANVDEAERQFAERGFVRGEPFVASLLQTFVPDATLPKEQPSEAPSAAERPLRIEWALPLRPAQRGSVDWLHEVEAAVDAGEQLVYSPSVPVTPMLAYSVRGQHLHRPTDERAGVPYRGAVLANEVGSGKTCCVLRLVAEEAPWRSPPVDALCSPATIVVCPVGMQQHWRDEARKFAPHMRVLTLTSLREMKAHTLQDLVAGCDLVLTTSTWIRSKPNTEATDALVGDALGLEPDRRTVRKSVVPASRALRTQSAERRAAHPPVLGLVTFRRCVVDEAHDVLGPSSARRERLRACRAVRAAVWFGLTATPNVSDAAALHEWAGLVLDADEEATPPCLAQRMESQLIRSFSAGRRTPPQRTVHRVVLSALERALLETHACSDTTRTVQLCSSTGAHFHDRVHSVEDVAQLLRAAQDEALAELSAGGEAHKGEVSERIAAIGRQKRFVDRMFTQLSTAAAECPVCLEASGGGGASGGEAWVALGCGHVLCAACAERLGGGFACPVCREAVQRTLRVAVGAPADMLRSRGSKLEAAAALLGRLAPARALVVAAWKPLLLSVKEALHEAGVAAELLEGPTTRRGAILRRFREGDTAALLLLCHGGFEGHDLSAATHVVFMHTLTEPTDEALRIEHQVLGRVQRDDAADVHVHHLVAADTEEERLWLAQHRT